MTAPTPLGFIGLGLMGTPMTRRLLAAGRRVTVWNRSPEKTDSALHRTSSVARNAVAGDPAAPVRWRAALVNCAASAVTHGP